MWKWYALVALLILLALPLPALAAHASQDADTIQATIDQWLADGNLQTITDAETAAASGGNYAQLLATDSQIDTYTADTVDSGDLGSGVIVAPIDDPVIQVDNAFATPTDALTNWTVVAPDIVYQDPPATISVDVYDGPLGVGYVIRLTYCLDNTCYEKRINNGPETWRDSQWVEFVGDQQ